MEAQEIEQEEANIDSVLYNEEGPLTGGSSLIGKSQVQKSQLRKCIRPLNPTVCSLCHPLIIIWFST